MDEFEVKRGKDHATNLEKQVQDKEDKERDAKIASRRNDKARAKHVPASPLAGSLRGFARS